MRVQSRTRGRTPSTSDGTDPRGSPPRYDPAVIDLHCHSACSDGTDSPEALAERAAAVGLRAVALTDHDTIAGFERFSGSCAPHGIRAIRGSEISCLDDGRSAHVLCYFVSDDPHSALPSLLTSLAEDRAQRNEQLFERLADLGYGRVTRDEVLRDAGGDATSIGRPHFADALLRLYPGAFASRQAVFDDFLGAGGQAYIQKAHVSIADASRAAAAEGAVTVLAHPLITLLGDVPSATRTLEQIERRVDPVLGRLRSDGLTGVECYYSRHDPAETELLVTLAARHGLVATGGSDYHGDKKPDISLGTGTGSLSVPDDLLDALDAARG
jgi:predicted metal-dependent phosphoesterase TrpH